MKAMYDFTKENASKILSKNGIYRFYNDKKLLIYIGKSKNLKSRIRSYFYIKSYDDQKFFDSPERNTLMKKSITYFDIEYTDTELEALLLEDDMIKEFWPEYNIKQKEFTDYKYLHIIEEEYPYFKISDAENIKSGKVFGPFKDSFFLKNILNLLGIYFGIRYCADNIPNQKCLRYDLAQCSGPCRDKISIADYNISVNRVIDFLQGDYSYVNEIMNQKIENYSKKMEYEKAQKILQDMNFFKYFAEKQLFVSEFAEKNTILLCDKIFLFTRGKFIGKYDNIDLTLKAVKKSLSTPLKREFIIDKANIVYSWIKSNKKHCNYKFFA